MSRSTTSPPAWRPRSRRGRSGVPLDHLWATWRAAYVGQVVDTRSLPSPEVAQGRSLFERIHAAADEEGDEAAGIVWRGPTCFALLNLYPYTAGHLMVLPNRAVS